MVLCKKDYFYKVLRRDLIFKVTVNLVLLQEYSANGNYKILKCNIIRWTIKEGINRNDLYMVYKMRIMGI